MAELTKEDIQKLLAALGGPGGVRQARVDQSMAQMRAQGAPGESRREGPAFDTSSTVGNRAIDANPSLAAALAMRQSQTGYAPGQIQAFRGLGSSLFLDPASTLTGQLQQLMAGRQAPARIPQRTTGPGPFGSSSTIQDPATTLRQKRLMDIEESLRRAELTKSQDNRSYARGSNERAQSAFEMLMNLLPRFIGKI